MVFTDTHTVDQTTILCSFSPYLVMQLNQESNFLTVTDYVSNAMGQEQSITIN